ncbi:serine/threonine-protein kinase RsbW [Microbacterium endophyticum]|uniref:Serine/threonine-protein kinase RsbW n=1 Tax=Microbacterium endophyticum TaxID=1526412 RepID=A0A7W4V3I9_9MICO|nr:ATP-binding protein [Microbacterium endophyticum]MBB2976182.1 serine/threonine-protein kinase RsbW [Microbacterium endophyticum]NIK36479.1 serine/threonine-protein kinase RsbW [Microbacterium endophyticum]
MNTLRPPSPAEYSADIRCPPDSVEDAHDFIQTVWEHHGDVVATDRMAMELVLSELVSNIIQNNPRRAVLCHVSVTVGISELLLRTSDTGVPVSTKTGSGTMPDETAESGRGLVLIDMVARSMDYRRESGRNVWIAVVDRTSQGS